MGRTNGIEARVIVIHRRWPRCDGNRRVLRRGSHQIYWRTGGLRAAKRHLGFDAGPLPAEGTRVARCSEICIRLAPRQPRIRTHWILVNSRSPEALISHDSALVQSTSVAGTILDYSSFLTEMSNWTCVVNRLGFYAGFMVEVSPAGTPGLERSRPPRIRRVVRSPGRCAV